MKRTFISLLFAATFFAAIGQKQTAKEQLLADETFLVAATAQTANFKIKCSNEKITALLLKTFTANLVRYSVSMKKDRFGKYAEYSIVFKSDAQDKIIAFLKTV